MRLFKRPSAHNGRESHSEIMLPFKPTITAVRPDGWFAKESATVLSPDGQANVIASSEPLDRSIDTERYASVQGDLLRKEFPGYREFSFGPTPVFGGHQGFLRHFEWVPPDGVPVTQLQQYFARNGRGYSATATTSSARFVEIETRLRAILGGLRIDD